MVNALYTAEIRANYLQEKYEDLDAKELLEVMILEEFESKIAVASSFGSESVIMLDLVAQIAPATPVIFLDTEKLFIETIAHREEVVKKLGLTNVRVMRPRASDLRLHDSNRDLWAHNPNLCCHILCVLPLERALDSFYAWVTGRKVYHGGERSKLKAIEATDGKVKINPLLKWSYKRIEAAFEKRGLPRHPLVAQGYTSIGCLPCTRRVSANDSVRAGRWYGSQKTECGIHLGREDSIVDER